MSRSSPILILALVALLGGVESFVTSTVPTKNAAPQPLAAFKFGGGGKAKSSTKNSPLAEEALDSFPLKFRPEDEVKGAPGSPKFGTTRSRALTTFNEMARVYGDERALRMVKTQPQVLTFESRFFEPSLNAWAEQFDLEAAQNMVERNPGLLAVAPPLAEEPAESSMAFSYVIWATRPNPLKVLVLSAALLVAFSPH